MSPQSNATTGVGRLADAFEDVFRVPVKLHAGLAPDDVEHFRVGVDKQIKAAGRIAEARGYDRQTVGKATYAAVALVDEAVLNSPHPVFRDWARHTLQETYWGDYTAGETFFRVLNELLEGPETSETGDLLEVFQTAMLLGFRGRYGDDELVLRGLVDRVQERIGRFRSVDSPLAPAAELPNEPLPQRLADPWVRRLSFGALAVLLCALVLFLLLRGATARSVNDTVEVAAGVVRT